MKKFMKNFLTKTKERLVKYRETLKTIVFALIVSYYSLPIPVYADDGSYLKPLINLKTIALALVAAAGVIVLIFGIVRFASAFQKMDQNGEHTAVYTIIAGGIMASAGTILAILTA